MINAINKSINEFAELYEDIATSDLQGIIDVRAAEITKTKLYSEQANAVSEQILSGIYKKVGDL
jgi:hypothetical protein